MKTEFIAFTAPGVASLLARDRVEISSSQVRIKTEMSLVSAGTERSFLKAPPFLPFTPGYSTVGHIIEVGADVVGFTPGDRVVAHAEHASEIVADPRFVAKIPDAVATEDAVFFNIIAVAIHSVRTTKIRFGDSLLIIGQGLVGLIASQIARLSGALPVIGVDIDPTRLELSRSLGVDFAFDARDVTAINTLVQSLPGHGVSATLELSATPSAMKQAIEFTRRRGRIVAAGVGAGAGGEGVSLAGIAHLRALELIAPYFNARPWRLHATETLPPATWPLAFEGGLHDYLESETDTSYGDIVLALRLIASERLKLTPLVTNIFKPAEAPELFNQVLNSQLVAALIRW